MADKALKVMPGMQRSSLVSMQPFRGPKGQFPPHLHLYYTPSTRMIRVTWSDSFSKGGLEHLFILEVT